MRCDVCKLDSDEADMYCRKCGRPIKFSPKYSVEELATERKMPNQAAKANSTKVLGPDFPKQDSPKMVEHSPNKGGSATATGRHPHRKLMIVSLSAVLAALLVVAGVTLISKFRRQQQTQTEQTQTPSVPGGMTKENSTPEPAVAVASPLPDEKREEGNGTLVDQKQKEDEQAEVIARQKDIIVKNKTDIAALMHTREDLVNEVADLKREIKEENGKIAALKRTREGLIKDTAEITRSLKKFQAMLTQAEGKLKDLNEEIADSTDKLTKLNTDIARSKRKLKGVRMEVARFNRQKVEIARLKRKLTDFKEEVSQRKHMITDLQNEIAWIKNADDAGRNHRKIRRA
jgi:predicted  nucleic acid-binding Zn-ribbon protein